MPKENQNNKSDDKDSFVAAFGIYGAVGFQLAFAVIAGIYLGYLVDNYLGTSPWLTLVGMIVGVTGGFYNLIRIVNWNQKRRERRKP